MDAFPERAESILGHRFEHQELLLAALTPTGNEQKRLATVGGEVLKVVAVDEWYRSGADLSECSVVWEDSC